jgi:hypothetical protein
VDWDIVERDSATMFGGVRVHSVEIDRVHYELPQTVPDERAYVVVADDPNGLAASPNAFHDRVFERSIVGGDGRQAI